MGADGEQLFISYKRSEAQGVAIQLYEKLDSLGFDVFLDTQGVPPAVDFQSVLWHRLADSDVVVLLDTPNFRASRWTVAELARANATSIQILHFLWPGVSPDPYSAFSQFVPLTDANFVNGTTTGAEGLFDNSLVSKMGAMVESLRSRAMAARHRYLVDNFCDQATALAQQTSVQSSRFISLKLTNARQIAVVPAIGVPNATRYQEIESAITKSPSKFDKIWLLYDDRGILQGWLDHVDWLNKHLPVIAVRVASCQDQIRSEAR
jgi:TIR domain